MNLEELQALVEQLKKADIAFKSSLENPDDVVKLIEPEMAAFVEPVMEPVEMPKKTAAKKVTSKTVTLNGNFKIERGLYEILTRNFSKNVSTLLIGETGCGKTEVVAHIAKDMGLPLHILDMGTMTDPISGLIGIHTVTIIDGKTTSTFKKSRFSEIIQQPGIVLLDELSRASTQANNLLFPCLDFRRQLSMEYCFEDQTPISVHPNCVFVATANLGSQYTGTHKIDRALLDRFMTVKVNTPDSSDMKASLKVSYPSVDKKNIDTIVTIYDNILKAHDEFKIDFKLSFRHMKYISAMVQDGFTIYDSFYAICTGLSSMEDNKVLTDILNVAKNAENEEVKSEITA